MLLSGDLIYQHTELEFLTITQLEPNQHYGFLRHISFSLPELKAMHLHYDNNDYPENKSIDKVRVFHNLPGGTYKEY